jgi:predicted HicB family RNase H-like nuclease
MPATKPKKEKTKRIYADITPTVHKTIAVLAARTDGATIKGLIEKAITDYATKHKVSAQ